MASSNTNLRPVDENSDVAVEDKAPVRDEKPAAEPAAPAPAAAPAAPAAAAAQPEKKKKGKIADTDEEEEKNRPKGDNVIDLMDALRRSVKGKADASESESKPKPVRKKPARKRAKR